MPLSIGNSAVGFVTFDDDELPDQLPWGGELASHEQQLSDGTTLLIITGEKPETLALSGTLRHTDSQGITPQQKMALLDTMRQQHQAVTVHGSPPPGSGGFGFAEQMVLTVTKMTYQRGHQVGYQIELARGVDLSTAATSSTAPQSVPASVTWAQVVAQAALAGPNASTAVLEAQQAIFGTK